MTERVREIVQWLKRFARSGLSARAFFGKHGPPFSLTRFLHYLKLFEASGAQGLADGRARGNNRRLHSEAEGFLAGFAAAHAEATEQDLRAEIRKRFGIDVSQPAISRCLKRLGISRERRKRPGVPASRVAAYGGFELVVALAWHFGWPQWTARAIQEAIRAAKRSTRFAKERRPDLKGRTRGGRFTARYNRRPDVRRERFQSVAIKRESRSLKSMNIANVQAKTLARKCLAVLSLPLVSHNGEVRTVNTAPGSALEDLCGFDYRQPTLTRFLAELKYLGISTDLLRKQVEFWAGIWRDVTPERDDLPLLCYYVDGNTKALWSSKRVKKHKVTMLGRVMGCLEQVFIHDGHGRPIYVETHSGHGPLGEHVLGLFEKIEETLEGPGPKLPVKRAIVMDAASNSVRTLRAFAAQKKYHYITSLDDNQWDLRKVRKEGRPQRYRFGQAILWDCEIELEDSSEKGYIFVTRAIKIEWDRGKQTYLITSLPKEIIGASQVVKAYFDRWPDEELPFKVMKAVGCLHRVAGYGKQELPDLRVRKRRAELAVRIRKLRERLHEPNVRIADAELEIAELILKDRRLRARSEVVDGKRILPSDEEKKFREIGRRIKRLQGTVNAIRKEYPDFRKLYRAEHQWIRLHGKDTVYKADVELDQLMTFFRLSLVNLYTYLARMMGWSHLELVRLVHSVLMLGATIQETPTSRHVVLRRNEKDPKTMKALSGAIEKINALEIRNSRGQKLSFSIA